RGRPPARRRAVPGKAASWPSRGACGPRDNRLPRPEPGGGIQIQQKPGTDLNPNSPGYQAADRTCKHYLSSLPGGGSGLVQTGSGGGGSWAPRTAGGFGTVSPPVTAAGGPAGGARAPCHDGKGPAAIDTGPKPAPAYNQDSQAHIQPVTGETT